MYRPRAAIAGLKQVRAERAGLKRRKPRALAEKRDVRRGFALKHLSNKHQLAVLDTIANTVADHSFAQHRRELKIANLIRMREQHQLRLRDPTLQCAKQYPSGAGFEQVVVELKTSIHSCQQAPASSSRPPPITNATEPDNADAIRCAAASVSNSRYSTSLPLLCDHQNFHVRSLRFKSQFFHQLCRHFFRCTG